MGQRTLGGQGQAASRSVSSARPVEPNNNMSAGVEAPVAKQHFGVNCLCWNENACECLLSGSEEGVFRKSGLFRKVHCLEILENLEMLENPQTEKQRRINDSFFWSRIFNGYH